MLKIYIIFTFTFLIFCLPSNSNAQNPCSQLTSSLEKITSSGKQNTSEKNTLQQTFTSTEGRFKIGLPPVTAAKSESNNGQKAVSQAIRYKWIALNLGRFEVSYYDGNRKLDDPSVSKTILDNLRNAIMSNGKGKLQLDKEVMIGSFPGREVKIKNDSGINILRFYLVESRLYTVSVFIPIKLECAVKGATNVLDTFELVNEKN